MRVEMFLIGGFLGAGKSTLIRRLVHLLSDRGERVGVVTNDQAQDLVDTRSVAAEGVPVAEVAGACFCCSFSELIERIEELDRQTQPQAILAEPVGSCTDLSATVLQPLKQYYGERFRVRPLAVLVDPRRALKILTGTPKGGFSPKAAYIYKKQLEEADVIVLNKIDLLDPTQRADVRLVLRERFAHAPLFEISARDGTGVPELLEALRSAAMPAGRRIVPVDYDIYAEGEAELGWLNAVTTVRSPQAAVSLDDLVERCAAQMVAAIAEDPAAEIAHLKALALGGGHLAQAHCTAVEEGVTLARSASTSADQVEMVLNVRAFAPPERLRTAWEQVCAQLEKDGFALTASTCRVLRPGRPVPEHRFSAPVGAEPPDR